jgi:hypothetical protein
VLAKGGRRKKTAAKNEGVAESATLKKNIRIIFFPQRNICLFFNMPTGKV